MNFTFPSSIPGTGTTTTASDANTSGMPNFSFGSATVGAGDANKPVGTGFSLMSTPQNKPGGLFNTGGNVGQTGFTFGTTLTTSIPSSGTVTNTTAPTLSFDIQTPNTSVSTDNVSATSGFNLSNSTIVSTPGFSFGNIKPTASTNITTNNAATTTATPTINSGFGIKSSKPPQTPGQIPTTTKPPTTLSGPASTSTWTSYTASNGFTAQGITPTTVTSAGFSLGGQPISSSTTTTASTGFTLGKTTASIVPTASTVPSITQTSLGTTTTVSASTGGGHPSTMNFCQLEESINKWTLELEEQEKAFVNQAAQVNAWDKLLISNGEKILTLNQEVERVKLEQQQLEHELDYVVGQQKELQDCLVPLEKELASLTVSDPEREYTYRLAENLDTQLKQMSEDLKEVIEHLNESNRAQDSSDPIVQIGKILNAHMNSLQWLDQRTAVLTQKIQLIDQMHQSFRQENERSLNLAYN